MLGRCIRNGCKPNKKLLSGKHEQRRGGTRLWPPGLRKPRLRAKQKCAKRQLLRPPGCANSAPLKLSGQLMRVLLVSVLPASELQPSALNRRRERSMSALYESSR